MKLKGRNLSTVPGWLIGWFVFSKYCAMFTATVGRYYPCFVIESLVRDTQWERPFAVHIQKRTGAVLALNSSNMSPKEGTESGWLFRAWQEAIEVMSGWRRTSKGSRVPMSSLLVYPLSLAQSRELSSPEDRVIFCVCPVLSPVPSPLHLYVWGTFPQVQNFSKTHSQSSSIQKQIKELRGGCQ